MGTLERRMATGVRSDDQPDLRADTRRNRDRILQTGVQRIALARPSRKIAKIAGIGGGTLYRRFQSRARPCLPPLCRASRWNSLRARKKDAHGAHNRQSDKEKFRSDLNRPESCEMSERLLKMLRKSGDFQAEYEGSIPFVCSNVFSALTRAPDCIPTNRSASFLLGPVVI
jgi:hypothetical protein